MKRFGRDMRRVNFRNREQFQFGQKRGRIDEELQEIKFYIVGELNLKEVKFKYKNVYLFYKNIRVIDSLGFSFWGDS